MSNLSITFVRFRTDHDIDYGNHEPHTRLISRKGFVTAGFLRGENLAVGQIVHAQTSDGNVNWVGWITARGLPDFSGNTAWYFVLYTKKNSAGGKLGGDVTVTVTVTDPTDPTQTTTVAAVPTPQVSDVPD
jgi:hypothetical protein